MDAMLIKENIELLKNKVKENNSSYKYDCVQIQGSRDEQQDTICVIERKNEILAILADGIGGMEKGDLASSLSVQEVVNTYLNSEGEKKFLLDGFENADDRIQKLKKEYSINSGTTLLSAHLKTDSFDMCCIGDSYLYLCQNNKLIQINRLHNYEFLLNQLLKEEKITKDDYKYNLSKKNMLISYIGKGDLSIIDYNKEPLNLNVGDVIILCSDGLLSAVSKEEILKIIKKNKNPSTINRTLMNSIYLKKDEYQDNTSIITITKVK